MNWIEYIACRGLGGESIYINEDLTKENHDFVLQIKKDCAEGVAVCIVDRCVLARCAKSRKFYRIVKSDGLERYCLSKEALNTVQF